jgi:hypothetical protein
VVQLFVEVDSFPAIQKQRIAKLLRNKKATQATFEIVAEF